MLTAKGVYNRQINTYSNAHLLMTPLVIAFFTFNTVCKYSREITFKIKIILMSLQYYYTEVLFLNVKVRVWSNAKQLRLCTIWRCRGRFHMNLKIHYETTRFTDKENVIEYHSVLCIGKIDDWHFLLTQNSNLYCQIKKYWLIL